MICVYSNIGRLFEGRRLLEDMRLFVVRRLFEDRS